MSPATDGALGRLARASTPIWLVQGNPRALDAAAIARGELPGASCVRRFVGALGPGDRVVLWLSGRAAGVHALGSIDGAVRPRPAVPGGAPGSRPSLEVPLDLSVDLFDRPIARDVLRADPRFASESIIRQPFAANPHRLSPAAFHAVLERLR